MISISGKRGKEHKIPKRLIDKYSYDFDISANLSKFYLTRNFNIEDILIKNISINNLKKSDSFILDENGNLFIYNNLDKEGNVRLQIQERKGLD